MAIFPEDPDKISLKGLLGTPEDTRWWEQPKPAKEPEPPLTAEQQSIYERLKSQQQAPEEKGAWEILKAATLPEVYGKEFAGEVPQERLPEKSLAQELVGGIAYGGLSLRKLPYQVVKIVGGDVLGSEKVKEAVMPAIENIEALQRTPAIAPSKQAESAIDIKKVTTGEEQFGEQLGKTITNPHWWAANLPPALWSLLEFYIYGGGASALATKAAGLDKAYKAALAAGAIDEASKYATKMAKMAKITGYGTGMAMEAAGAEEHLRQWEKENPDKKISWPVRIMVELGGGILAGALEAFSFFHIFGGKNGKRLIFKILDSVATEGATEGAQEIVANAFRKYGYDPDQHLLENVVESILIGAAVGGLGGTAAKAREAIAENRERVRQIIEGKRAEGEAPAPPTAPQAPETPEAPPSPLGFPIYRTGPTIQTALRQPLPTPVEPGVAPEVPTEEPLAPKAPLQRFLPGYDWTVTISPEEWGGSPVPEAAPPGTPVLYGPGGGLARMPEYILARWQVAADYEEAISKPGHQRTAEEKWLIDTVERRGIDAALPPHLRTPGAEGAPPSTVLGPWGGPASERPIYDATGKPIDKEAPPPPPPVIYGPTGQPITKPLPPAFGGRPRMEPVATTGDETTHEAVTAPEGVPRRPQGLDRAALLDRIQVLAQRVDRYGDINDVQELTALLEANRETLRDMFSVPPEDRSAIRPIAERLYNLINEVEETGDPGAARELSDLIAGNRELLSGVTRWEIAREAGKEPTILGPSAPTPETVPAGRTRPSTDEQIREFINTVLKPIDLAHKNLPWGFVMRLKNAINEIYDDIERGADEKYLYDYHERRLLDKLAGYNISDNEVMYIARALVAQALGHPLPQPDFTLPYKPEYNAQVLRTIKPYTLAPVSDEGWNGNRSTSSYYYTDGYSIVKARAIRPDKRVLRAVRLERDLPKNFQEENIITLWDMAEESATIAVEVVGEYTDSQEVGTVVLVASPDDQHYRILDKERYDTLYHLTHFDEVRVPQTPTRPVAFYRSGEMVACLMPMWLESSLDMAAIREAVGQRKTTPPPPEPLETDVWDTTTTGDKAVDDLLQQGLAAMVEMSPEQFLERTGGVGAVSPLDTTRIRREMEQGRKFPVSVMNLVTNIHTGREAAAAAMALGVQTMPVVIIDDSVRLAFIQNSGYPATAESILRVDTLAVGNDILNNRITLEEVNRLIQQAVDMQVLSERHAEILRDGIKERIGDEVEFRQYSFDEFDTVRLADEFRKLIKLEVITRNRPLTTKQMVDFAKRTFTIPQNQLQRLMKEIEEAFECAFIEEVKEFVQRATADGRHPLDIMSALERFYSHQPVLKTRTSDTIRNQAYSTPLPLAFIMSRAVRLTDDDFVYEPTAGNGMLLIEANPETTLANEIDPLRASHLEKQGFRVTRENAVGQVNQPGFNAKSFDVVLMNPPFGSLPEATKFDGYTIKKLEHLIALHALQAMDDNGRAALIIGGHSFVSNLGTPVDKLSEADRIFFNYLYSRYNVTHHINIDGDVYRRMGTSYPIRLIIIEGRKAQPDNALAPQKPNQIEYAKTFNEVYQLLKSEIEEKTPNPYQPPKGTQYDVWDTNTTGMPHYDRLMQEGLLGRVVMMDPLDYLREAGGRQLVDDNAAEAIKDRMLAGEKFPILVLDKRAKTHEGRHRAAAAAKLNIEAVPVFLIPEPVPMPNRFREAVTKVYRDLNLQLDTEAIEMLWEIYNAHPHKDTQQGYQRYAVAAIKYLVDVRHYDSHLAGQIVAGIHQAMTAGTPPPPPPPRPPEKDQEKQPPKGGTTVQGKTQDGRTVTINVPPGITPPKKGAILRMPDGTILTIEEPVAGWPLRLEEPVLGRVAEDTIDWGDINWGDVVIIDIGQRVETADGKVGEIVKVRGAYDWARVTISTPEGQIIVKVTDIVRNVPTTEEPAPPPKEEEKEPESKPKPKLEAGAYQVLYVPRSKGPTLYAMAPKFMADAIGRYIEALQEEVGDIDEYVANKLQYADKETLYKAFSAEQIETLALSIYAFEKKRGFIMGHQTGVGKGRVVAGMMRYALANNLIPIFITAQDKLHSDMYRDVMDITEENAPEFWRNFNPLIIASNSAAASIKTESGELIKRLDDAAIRRALRERSLGPHNAVMSTYYQFQTNDERTLSKKALLLSIAPRAILILDESHKAAGVLGKNNQVGLLTSRRHAYFHALSVQCRGTLYSSATYAKRPENLLLYTQTDLGRSVNPNNLIDVLQDGGVPLQEWVSNQLASNGQMSRLELSFTFNGKPIEIEPFIDFQNAERDTAISDKVGEFARALVDFTKRFHAWLLSGEGPVDLSSGDNPQPTDAVNLSYTHFGSLMHNMVSQLLFALRANHVINEAIEQLKNGNKVVITCFNTMEAFFEYSMGQGELEVGKPLNLDFTAVLFRALERSLRYRVVLRNGTKINGRVDPSELPPQLYDEYRYIQDMIRRMSLNLPASPIDYIGRALTKAGYKVGEITGRSYAADWSSDEMPVRLRTDRERRDKNTPVNQFNSGELDALIINSAAAEGISLHASERFRDQRPRVMIMGQLALDINDVVQLLGRIHRTGQVHAPIYKIAISSLPTEIRPLIILTKKLASLYANISAKGETSYTLNNVVDTMNQYGDRVLAEMFADDPDTMVYLTGDAIGTQIESAPHWLIHVGFHDMAREERISTLLDRFEGAGGFVKRVTGYVAIQSVENQKAFYKAFEERYKDYVDYLKQSGEYKLASDVLDLQARTVSRFVLSSGDEKAYSGLLKPTWIEKVKARVLQKPYTAEEVEELIKKNLKGKTPDQHMEELIERVQADFRQYASDMADIIPELDRRRVALRAANTEKERTINLLNSLRIGMRWSIQLTGGPRWEHVLLDIKYSPSIGNPGKMSNFKLVVADNSARRRYTLSLSNIGSSYLVGTPAGEGPGPNWQMYPPVQESEIIEAVKEYTDDIGGTYEVVRDDNEDIDKIFVRPAQDGGFEYDRPSYKKFMQYFKSLNWQINDREYRLITLIRPEDFRMGGYETRYILTGNLLYQIPNGQFVYFTRHDGRIEFGKLLPVNYNPLGDRNIDINNVVLSPREIPAYLPHSPTHALLSGPVELGLTYDNPSTAYLTVPASRQDGGRYYLNDGLLALTGTFVSRGNQMVAEFSRDRLEDVAAYLVTQLGVRFVIPRQEYERVFGAPGNRLRLEETNLFRRVAVGGLAPQWVPNQKLAKEDQELEEVMSYGSKIRANAVVREAVRRIEEVSRRYNSLQTGTVLDRLSAQAYRSRVALEYGKQRYVNITGRKLTRGEEAKELAELMAAFRSPSQENFHAVYTAKDGTVLAHTVLTSGALNYVNISSRVLYELRRRAERLGAAKVHFIHNHPSGNPNMSRSDIRVAQVLQQGYGNIPGMGDLMGEFVVIDSKSFTYLENMQTVVERPYEPNRLAKFLLEKVQILGTLDAAHFASGLNLGQDQVAIAYLTANNDVNVCEIHDAKILQGDVDKVTKKIRERMKAFDARHVIIFTPSFVHTESLLGSGKAMGDWLLDIVTPSGMCASHTAPQILEQPGEKPVDEREPRVLFDYTEEKERYYWDIPPEEWERYGTAGERARGTLKKYKALDAHPWIKGALLLLANKSFEPYKHRFFWHGDLKEINSANNQYGKILSRLFQNIYRHTEIILAGLYAYSIIKGVRHISGRDAAKAIGVFVDDMKRATLGLDVDRVLKTEWVKDLDNIYLPEKPIFPSYSFRIKEEDQTYRRATAQEVVDEFRKKYVATPEPKGLGERLKETPGKLKQFFRSLYAQVVDRWASWEYLERDLIKEINAKGAFIPSGEKISNTLSLMRGMEARVREALFGNFVYSDPVTYDETLKTYVFTGEPMEVLGESLLVRLDPLRDLAKRLGKTNDEVASDLFHVLMPAQRDLELAGEFGNREAGEIEGVHPEESRVALQALQEKYGAENYRELEKIADSIREWADTAILQPLLRAGIISRRLYEEIKERNIFYVPFMRLMEELEGYLSANINEATTTTRVIHEIKGSTRKILDPFEMLIKLTYRAHFAYARNRVFHSLYALAKYAEYDGVQEIPSKFYEIPIELEQEIDSVLRPQIEGLARALGFSIKMVMKLTKDRLGEFRGWIARNAEGETEVGGEIITRFATTEKVSSHELGHALDLKYGLKALLIDGGTPEMKRELRRIADQRCGPGAPAWYRRYTRQKGEQVAEFVNRFITERDVCRRLAPTATARFEEFCRSTPALRPLLEFAPSARPTLRKFYTTIWQRSPFPPEKGVLPFYKNGVLCWLKVPPEIYNAAVNMMPSEVGVLMKIAKFPADLLRTGAVHNPEFVIRNPIRDIIQAWLLSSFGFSPLKWFRDAYLLMTNDPETRALFAQFMAGGGALATLSESFITHEEIRPEHILNPKGKIRYFAHPIEALRYAAAYLENLTRFSVYKQAREKGLSHADAIHEARRTTLDYSRVGGHPAIRYLGMLIPFFNAAIQGGDKIGTEMITGPNRKKVWMRMAFLATLSILIYLVASRDRRYKELEHWERNYFWHLPLGDNMPILRIPKPFEAGILFGSVPVAILEWALDKDDGKGIKKALEAAWQATTPEIVPTLVRPIVEFQANYDFFRGRAIEDASLRRLPVELRAKPWTTELAKAWGRHFGEATGISPVMMEHFIRTVGGGLASNYLLPGIDIAMQKAGLLKEVPKPDRDTIQKLWGVRAFFAKEPIGYQSRSVNDFLEKYQDVIQAEAAWRSMVRGNQTKEAEKYLEEHPEIMLARYARKAIDDMAELRRQRDTIYADTHLTPEKKRAKLDEIDRRITKIAQVGTTYLDEEVAKKAGLPSKDAKPYDQILLSPATRAFNKLAKRWDIIDKMEKDRRIDYLARAIQEEREKVVKEWRDKDWKKAMREFKQDPFKEWQKAMKRKRKEEE